jgi:hypothetical protein
VAEVSAHVVIGKRSAAMAFRLEALGDRWLCTALELGAHWRSAMRPEPLRQAQDGACRRVPARTAWSEVVLLR